MESPPSGAGEKLRLMCSYGGHIIPRPHDKSLCYAGGETRLVAVNRKTAVSISSLTAHLTKMLQFPQPPFTVKYQLPDHDLDSLISISTDEDLANMIDEYDRLAASSSPSRIRFFLFPAAANDGGGLLLHDPKTEGWFIDALRSAGVKSRLGDSGTSLPESIPVDERERDRENSSFGSTSSSSYLPAVRGSDSGSGCGGGGGEDSGVVIGSQFQDVKVALPSLDSLGSDTSIPSPNFSQQTIVYHDASGFPEPKAVSAHFVENESMSSDRSPRSDILTPVQVSGYILSKPMDHPPQAPSPPLPAPPPTQQYIYHPAPQTHYLNQYYPNSVPVASYPTMYQPYIQAQQPAHYHQINKPYPVYMMAVGQPQRPYDMSMQCSVATPQAVTPSQPQVASNTVVVPPDMVYEGYKSAAAAPEYAAKVYKATAVVAQPASGSTGDHHNQVVAFPPPAPAPAPAPALAPAPPQPVVVSSFENTNYLGEYEDPMHAQIYKTQPSVPSLPSQLQTTTNTATVMLSESVTQ